MALMQQRRLTLICHLFVSIWPKRSRGFPSLNRLHSLTLGAAKIPTAWNCCNITSLSTRSPTTSTMKPATHQISTPGNKVSQSLPYRLVFPVPLVPALSLPFMVPPVRKRIAVWSLFAHLALHDLALFICSHRIGNLWMVLHVRSLLFRPASRRKRCKLFSLLTEAQGCMRRLDADTVQDEVFCSPAPFSLERRYRAWSFVTPLL